MNKKQLLQFPVLKVTAKMVECALNDKQEQRNKYSDKYFNIGAYIRAKQYGDILAVAIFETKYIRAAADSPRYTIFIDKANDTFITYSHYDRKWLSAKINNLDNERYYYSFQKHMSFGKTDTKAIQDYFKSKEAPFKAIIDFQQSVRNKELIARHKRETAPWDADMALVPKTPKDFKRWVDKVALDENFIFYQYSKKGADKGYCSWCEREVNIKNPKHNKLGKCPHCHHEVTYKSEGKAGTFLTNVKNAYLIQQIKSGIIIRQFRVHTKFQKGKYKTPEVSCFEVRRTLYDDFLTARTAYFFGLYKQTETRWIKTSACNNYGWLEKGKIYSRNSAFLGKCALNRTGLLQIMRSGIETDPEIYLCCLRRFPDLEKISKLGLTALANEIISDRYYNEDEKLIISPDNKDFAKALGLDKSRLKRLIGINGGTCHILWLRYEKALNRNIADTVISWFCKYGIKPNEISFIIDRMSETQVCNYLKRQMEQCKEKPKDIIQMWSDYLKMAHRLKYNVNDAIIYRAKELRKRHDEVVQMLGDKNEAMFAAEVAEKFPDVDDICKAIKSKYEFTGDVYSVVAPNCIEDIVAEGRALNHCVGKSERYFERIQHHETYILFLRQNEEIDKPYYTLEIEPDGTVRQKRTEFDRQKPDIEEATKFLKKWQREISKRLLQEDIEKAMQSKANREIELSKLREKGTKISGTDYDGQLLADVLQADIVENNALMERKIG